MKASHRRILDAIRRGGTVTRLSRSRVIWVSVWIAVGKYETFKVRRSTVAAMEELNLLRCVDQYAQDLEWQAT